MSEEADGPKALDDMPAAKEAQADEPLGFDRAEFASSAEADAAPACSACKRPLGKHYFTINEAVTCEDCHHLVSSQLREAKGARALLRAAALGAAAALAGSIVWYAVAKITGMEIGLLAIAVGFVVGHAVRKGSRSPGGRRYQALAMLLTYVSITGSYVPIVVKTLADHKPAATASPAPTSPDPAAPATSVAANAPTTATPPLTPAIGIVQVGVAFVFVFGIALIAPFLGGASNIIGLVLIAIALYEAWKLNKTVPIVMSGPLRTNKARSVSAALPGG